MTPAQPFFVRVVALIALVACGSSVMPTTPPPPPAPPPPPPAPGAPSTLTIVSGDGQSGVPGTALAAKLSVQVKDVAGLAVPGVVVHFSVDSGGGSLDSASATTNASGLAVAGTWTIGAVGGNVVTATFGTLAPVHFHAQAFGPTTRTLFNGLAIGTGGGALKYTRTADALNGLTLTMLPGSYPAASTWTIVADSTIVVPLPAGFGQVGPVLVISNTQGFADSLMTLTMPMHLASTIAVAPFYFDPVTRFLEPIPLVGRTDSSVTLATRHFSSSFMWIPGSQGTASLRASARLGFGDVRIVWVQIPKASLVGTYDSGFRPGTDDWEFENWGDYLGPAGDCEGMSISEMYYFYLFHRAPNPAPTLFGRYQPDPVDQKRGNVRGIRFAGAVQFLFAKSSVVQTQTLIDLGVTNGVSTSDLTPTWIALTLKLTGNPVLINLQSAQFGHAVVAYSATVTASTVTVGFADPNYPGNAGRTMVFEPDLTPVPLQINAGAASSMFTSAYALGVSSLPNILGLDFAWQDFTNKAPPIQYPADYALEYFDPLALTWGPLPDTVRTSFTDFKLRMRCGDCSVKYPDGFEVADFFDPTGSTRLGFDELTSLPLGISHYAIEAAALTPYGSGEGFVDMKPITVIYGIMTLQHTPATITTGDTVRFTAFPNGLGTAGSKYVWTFGDGTSGATVFGDSTVTHIFAAPGNHTVVINLFDNGGRRIASASTGSSTTIKQSISPMAFGGAAFGVAAAFDGTLRTWGFDVGGQLGDGDTVTKASPINGPPMTGVASVAGGGLTGVALMNDGTVRAWGGNYFGSLGDGNTAQIGAGSVPVTGLTNIVQIAAGGYQAMALRSDGNAWVWGNGFLTPVQAGLTSIVQVAVGVANWVFLRSDSTVWIFGDNSTGALGDNFAETTRSIPLQVTGLPKIARLANIGGYSIGQQDIMAIAADSTVWAWGGNGWGQLGNGQSVVNQGTPIQVPGLNRVVAVAAGTSHTLALRADGTVWSWGNNSYGQLGMGDSLSRVTPSQVPGLSNIGGIAIGESVSAAWTKDGTQVWTWGRNDYSALGLGGGASSVLIPTPVFGLRVVPMP